MLCYAVFEILHVVYPSVVVLETLAEALHRKNWRLTAQFHYLVHGYLPSFSFFTVSENTLVSSLLACVNSVGLMEKLLVLSLFHHEDCLD